MGNSGVCYAGLDARSGGRVRTRRVPRAQAAGMVATLAVCDAAAAGLAIGAVVGLRSVLNPQLQWGTYAEAAPMLLLLPLVLAGFGLYPGIAIHPAAEIALVFRGVSTAFLLMTAATFFQRDAEVYSRAVLLLAWPAAVLAVALMRAAARAIFARQAWWGQDAVILGSGPLARKLALHLNRQPGLGLRVVGLLGEREEARQSGESGVQVIGDIPDAPVIAEQLGVRRALVAVPREGGSHLAKLIERYAASFHRVHVIPDLPGVSSLGVHAHDMGGMIGVEISHRLLFRIPQTVKRACDFLLAALGLLVLAPVFAAIAALVRLSGKGPVFYGSARIGRGGQVFKAWKFRTMVLNADKLLERHLEADPELREEWRKDRKLKHDPRITWCGRILRRTSLDELPQLWNVLCGEMSLIGPRPISEGNVEVEKYGTRYALYKQVRPGISGLWQVSGRNNTTYEERVELDEYYVRNWSVWLDLYILGRTFRVVMTGDGAY